MARSSFTKKILAAIREWLWQVLARPMLEHIDKWTAYHAQVIERRLLTELDRMERASISSDNALIKEVRIQADRIAGKCDVILGELRQHASIQEIDAVSFAAEKMVLDQDFWKLANHNDRISKIEDWAKIYCSKNNWAVPDPHKLRYLVNAKLDQIKERKVGPTQ